MLPILRLIPVGGVALAIVILVLALNSPGGPYPPAPRVLVPARGALIATNDDPQWPYQLLKAALRRADELSQLRQLPQGSITHENTPAEQKPEKLPEVAGVPDNRADAEPEGATGTATQSKDSAIPVDIGEASATELPVAQEQERPPAAKTPERENATKESHNVAAEPPTPATTGKPATSAKPVATAKVTPSPEPAARKPVRRAKRAKVTAPAADPAQFNLLAAFFASFNVEQPAVKPRR